MNINKLHNIIEEKVANLDMLNWIFRRSYRLQFEPIIDFNLTKKSDEEFEINFVLDDYFTYTNQSVKFKLFQRDFNDKFLGVTLEQLQSDLLSGVVSYIFVDENDENLIKWHRLAEINENLFKKYGFEKGKTEKFHSTPNQDNLSRTDDIIAYVSGGIAWTLTDGLNLDEKSNNYLETRSDVLSTIVSSVDSSKLEGKKVVVEEILDSTFKDYDDRIEENRTNSYSTAWVYAIGKNQDFFESYSKSGVFCSNWSLALNHRSLFEPKFIYCSNDLDPQLPKNGVENKFDLSSYKKLELSKLEKILVATRNEVFNFNDDEIKLFLDITDFKYKLGEFIAGLTSTNRIAQRRNKSKLQIFSDEEYILDCVETFMDWFKIVANVMELVTNENVDKIADAVEDLEDYLNEDGDYVLVESKQFFEEFYDKRRFLLADKMVDLLSKDFTLSDDAKDLALVYVTNYGFILDVIENQFKDIELGE